MDSIIEVPIDDTNQTKSIPKPNCYFWSGVCVAGLLCVVLILLIIAFVNPTGLDRFGTGVWMAYLLPSGSLWDRLHAAAEKSGGIWHYNESVMSELDHYISFHHPHYRSLWDVSCNEGYILLRLQQKHPHAQHYGSDISSMMVKTTRNRCPACHVEVFDLFDLQWPHRPIPRGFPPVFDVIVVSDVLFYASWAGLPPLLFHIGLLPSFIERKAIQRFTDRLTSMACDEVVFSNHEHNPTIQRLFRAMGATQKQSFWALQGQAPAELCNNHATRLETHDSSQEDHMRKIFTRRQLVM
eukprot:GHVU01035335.1.p1 GENE.GHVU01035335.1~~GHVU01035335.1.p1  ORF type:complete len:296 (-),score=2.73 GHVU01035335.1:500-1387(-)